MGRRDRTLCITHGGDLDGLASAALVSRVWDADVLPVGYDEVPEVIRRARATRLFITDLGLSSGTFPELLKALRGIGEVTIIDHHPMSEEQRRSLLEAGVKLVHDTEDCTTVLAYEHLKARLPPEASRLAAYAALTDYMELGPRARPIVERFERITLFVEAALYALAIIARERSKRGLLAIVARLRDLGRPQEDEAIVKDAIRALARLDRMRRYVTAHLTRMGDVGIVETRDDATGTAATLALEVGGGRVAIAYREKGDVVKVSSRSVASYQVHLGELMARAAEAVGGVGGGHRHATGARIPRDRLQDFLMSLVSSLPR